MKRLFLFFLIEQLTVYVKLASTVIPEGFIYSFDKLNELQKSVSSILSTAVTLVS